MPVASLFPESAFDRRRHPDALVLSTWTAPDGWPHRAYRWPGAGATARGSLIFQSGRIDYIEKYLEACDHWHRDGWAVEGFDWRGQGGSGRLIAGHPADHRDSFDPLVDDLEAYVAEWRARTPGPHVLVAHSMGGHVAFRLLAERGVVLDGLVLVAPMLRVDTGRIPLPLARVLVGAALRLGRRRRAAWRERRDDSRRQARLTADRERFDDAQWWKDVMPELAGGPPSWGWLAAAFAAGDLIERLPLERVRTPVLLLAAGEDGLVDGAMIARVAARLPDAELRVFPEAAHELLREADDHRRAAMAAIDDFLARKAPAR
ncbi:MAG TPA: alpha/beta hydrolase [Sphingomonas sp.]